ncbi:DUF4913 domain-containing protein [Streptomyces sp. NPDC055817]
MSEPARDGAEPVRIPDHDLDDLVSTVTQLVTATRKQNETLARLSDEEPSINDGADGEAESVGAETSPSAAAQTAPDTSAEAPTSIFILALDGTAYTEELATLTIWVDALLLPVYGREVTTSRPWCEQWLEHPEAVARLHALWLAWQQLTDVEAGLTGPSTWHRDHLDPTLLQLRTPDGPFGACTTNATRPNHRLLASPQSAGPDMANTYELARVAAQRVSQAGDRALGGRSFDDMA